MRGLTTAAGLWAVAAIGMTAGAGLILGAAVATATAITILYGLGLIEYSLRSRRAAGATRPVGITLDGLGELSEVVMMACALDQSATEVGVKKADDGTFVIEMQVAGEKVPTVSRESAGSRRCSKLEQDPG